MNRRRWAGEEAKIEDIQYKQFLDQNAKVLLEKEKLEHELAKVFSAQNFFSTLHLLFKDIFYRVTSIQRINFI